MASPRSYASTSAAGCTRLDLVLSPANKCLRSGEHSITGPGRCRPVERLVCLAKQPLEVVPRPPLANPYAAGQSHLFAAGQDWRVLAWLPGGALQHPLGRRLFPLRLPYAHYELVTPPPRDPVPLANAAAQHGDEVLQAGVSCVVAVLIVYGLEPVEVQHRKRECPSSPFGPRDVFEEMLFPGPAVVDPGE